MQEVLSQVYDDKGRPVPISMTEREMLEETVLTMRMCADAIQLIANNPVLSAMVPGLPKF